MKHLHAAPGTGDGTRPLRQKTGSGWKNIYAPLAGIAASVLLILGFAQHPAAALASLFTDTFTSAYYFGNMLNTAAFFMIAGTGAALAIQGGNMNLGGEGQVYIGGFAGCTVLNALHAPAPLVFCAALVLACASGAAMALVSALLRELRGARVLLTSFLVSAAAIPLIDGLITSSRHSADTNMLALPYIAQQYRLPQILPPSPLSPSIFLAVAICIAAWHVLYRTAAGRRIRLWGAAPQFARYCGYPAAENTCGTAAASGALHALTGFLAVCGTFYTCHKGFYTNMGWNALNVALIAASDPLAVIPTSVMLAWIFTSASRVSLTQGFSFDIAGIVQGVILFSIAVPAAARTLAAQTQKGREAAR